MILPLAFILRNPVDGDEPEKVPGFKGAYYFRAAFIKSKGVFTLSEVFDIIDILRINLYKEDAFMILRFFTPTYCGEEFFGAATLGFAGDNDDNKSYCRDFPYEINGRIVYGSYEHCLNTLRTVNSRVCIALLGNGGDENEFIKALRDKINIPIVGGSAAIDSANSRSTLVTGRANAALFFEEDDRFDFVTECENIHYDIISEHKISFSHPRYIDKIDGNEPCEWLASRKKEIGIPDYDFEHLTLADSYGINVHLSLKDGRLFSGRDLSENMYLRYLPEDKAQERIQSFYDDTDSLIFGCAGLKQTLKAPLCTDSLGLFMFGEICTVGEHSDFGNLMLSKLKVIKK